MPKAMKINGREFQVEAREGRDGRPVYELRGKRGAHYFTMRNEPNPALMFICNARGMGVATAMESVWLTDEGGELREV